MNLIYLVQNEIINNTLALGRKFNMDYKDLCIALGYVEGKIAQMAFTQETYQAVEQAEKQIQEQEKQNENQTSDEQTD